MKKLIKYLLPVITLMMGTQVQAQWYNDGAVTNPGGLVSDWTGQGINTATGSYSTVGSTGAPDKYGVFEHSGQTGTGANSALVNNGTYDASVNGRDYFLGPSRAAGQQGIGGTSAPTFGELFLQNGAGQLFDITNSNGANVDSITHFANGITTTVRSNSSTGALRFLDNAVYSNTVVGDAQYVNGYVSKVGNDAFTFPVGDQSGGDLRTLSISAPATATDHVSIAYWKGDPSTGLDPTGGAHSTTSLNTTPLNGETLVSVSSIGFWDWVPVSGTDNMTVTVSLPQNAGVLGGYSDATKMRLVGWNTANRQWELLGNTSASGTGEDATLSGSTGAQAGRTMASYSAIGWASIVQLPLPVTLLAFHVAKESSTVQLSWSTTAETNSDYFEVQRSANAKNWQSIGTKSAYGESTVLQRYGFTDEKALKGLNYYRLKMVDKDLTYAYSSIQSLNFGENGNGLISLYPNPAQDQIRIKADYIASIERIEIMSANGQLLYRQNRGSSAIDDRINVKDLRSGIYVVRLTRTDGSVTALKIIKQ